MTRSASGARTPRGLQLGEWVGPALAFAVSVFSFGILLARLGFFQDDWHHVFYAYWQGPEGLQRFLLTDRGPFAWPIYAAFFRILGVRPAAWHWSLMILRFLTVLAFWLVGRRLWPRGGPLASWIALIFCVYPIFTLQPLAVAYTLHWAMFLVFMLSLYLMLEAQTRPSLFLALTIASLLLEVAHLALIEYFSGLELARAVFLWLLFAGLAPRDRLGITARRALPYLLILGLYAAYRSSFATLFGYDRFQTLTTLVQLVSAPWVHLQSILQVALQDLDFILISQWYAAIEPSVIDLSRPSSILILLSIVGFAALTWAAFGRAERHPGASSNSRSLLDVAAAGLAVVVLSMLPFWLTGFSIYQKNQLWSERLALAAMPGASMLMVGGVFGLVERPAFRRVVLSLLLGIGVGLQAQTARAYQVSWDKQRDLYWQLRWRAPAIEPGTILVADQEILFFMGIYPTAFALNLLYPQVTAPPVASYWFNAGFEHMDFDRFAAGTPDAFEKYSTTFTADPHGVLAITFEPGLDQCLWILRPDLANAGGLTSVARTWLTLSDPSRIEVSPPATPPTAIFGSEPPHSWCFFFEQADLARQYQQWDAVRSIWVQAEAANVRAANGVELVPFIEAAARLGDWKQAQSITRRAQSLPDRSTSLFCDVWRNVAGSTPSTTERDDIVAAVQLDLGCQPW